MAEKPSVSNARNKMAMVVVAASAAAVALAGCSSGSKAPAASSADVCSPDHARPLPAAGVVNSYKDTRDGKIYPCFYMLDMNIPTNKPTKLSKIAETTFDESQFTSRSSFGGLLILGTGGGLGSSAAQGSTTRKDMYAMQILDSSGAYTKLMVDSEKVRLKPCNDCEASVEIDVQDVPLFDNSDTNHESIWRSGNPSMETWKRYNTVEEVSITLPREQVTKDVNMDGSISGGPKTPGDVVSALATSIIVTLPEQILNNPTKLGN